MNASTKSLFRPDDAVQAGDLPVRSARGGGRRARPLAAAVGLCTAAGLALLPSSAIAAPAAFSGGAPAGARDAATSKPVDHFLAVSCPARRMCIAVGIAGTAGQLLLAERWNGRRWILTHPVLPAKATSGGLTGVSCSSSRACTAVGFDFVPATGGGPLAEHWNGHRWRIQPTPQLGNPGSQLSGVSCSSPSVCTAVGDYEGQDDEGPGTAPLALRWNGATWAVQPTPGASSAMDNEDSALGGVSCPAVSACIAVGYDPNSFPLALRWNGARWTSQQITGLLPLSAGSCWSASRCIAVGDADFGGFAERLRGQTWALQQVQMPVGTHSIFLTGVSCSVPSRRTAVGYQAMTVSLVTDIRTLAERWNGHSWVVQAAPSL